MPKLKVEIKLSPDQDAILKEVAAKSHHTRETWVEGVIRTGLDIMLAEKNTPPMVFSPPKGCESRYGKTARQLKNLFKKQGEQCALCGDTKHPYRVDHTEPGGKPFVRGILCNPCNTLLGCFDDVPDRLRDCIKRKVYPGRARTALQDWKKRTGMNTRDFTEKALAYLKKTERAVKNLNGGTYPRKVRNDKNTRRVWVPG